VRPFFLPQARKDRAPGGPGFSRIGRVEFSFLVYTISKNALHAQAQQSDASAEDSEKPAAEAVGESSYASRSA
jgi:hypothetical protein